ncbi:MAG: hypothetical protein KAS22_10620, partial [Candidatus Heimdallarchaeota archaeon]|nr:hypothetical protein [Candidatus Heimdallarchaeota archaeon]
MVGKHTFFQGILTVTIITFVLFGSITTSSDERNLEKPTLLNKKEIQFSISVKQNKGESLGEQHTFWVVDPSTGNYEQVTAKLLSIGQYCYIYVDLTTINEIGETEATERSNRYSSEFDSIMYPNNLELVGHPDGLLGDIDGDPKITVLFSPESYGGAYFFKDDDPTHPYSNNREMVYIHSNLNEQRIYSNLIHELNHLIWFNHE